MSSSPTVPFKTPLGQQELRQRCHALGQRHRTVLFLVDGRRTLGDVLALAHQAGAQTSHFEELVRLGLIELPIVEEAVEDVPAAAAPIEIAEVPVVAAIELSLLPAAAEPQVAPVAEPTAVAAEASPTAAAPAPLPAEMLQPVDKPPPRARHAAVASRAAVDDELTPAARDEVRRLLIDTLSLASPVFAARMLMRVRGAQSARELIDLVWEIEGRLNPARRSRGEFDNLARARDVLGLGNTLVAEDSRLETIAEMP